jgi:hypothetical protein
MHHTITIKARYNGPPKSANGGYACGLMAAHLKGAVEASLKVPPLLNKAFQLEVSTGSVRMLDGEQLIGSAREVVLDLEVPRVPRPLVLAGDPVDAPGRPKKFAPFETCFVCGHDRHHPDGLCIHSKLVEGAPSMVASPWMLDGDYADADGMVRPEILWSALDCPGYFACAPGEAALLARLTCEILKPLPASGEATVIGWDLAKPGATVGRKRTCGTAVFDANGALVAKAKGLWIIVDPARMKG